MWTRHLRDDQEIKQFQNKINASKPVLDRIKVYLEEEYEALELVDIEHPNYALKRAYSDGDRSRILKILKLVDLDKQGIK